MRPKSEIYTPKRDDEHPPPTPRDRSLKKFELGAWFFFLDLVATPYGPKSLDGEEYG